MAAARNGSLPLRTQLEIAMHNPIHWFEIPASDFERATHFYETVFAVSLRREQFAGFGTMAVFPYSEGQAGGAVVAMEQFKPGSDGPVLYLDGGADLSGPLQRAVALGGKVLLEKTQLPDSIGSIALFLDSEGNRIGLHSPA
jgi:hypothetical protein